MRSAVCILLSFMLFFSIGTLDVPKNSRLTAWWGVLFPQVFAQPDGTEQVTFTWPFLERLFLALRLNG